MSDEHQILNKPFRVILQATEEVTGANGMAALLRQVELAQYVGNYPPNDLRKSGIPTEYASRLVRGLLNVYGARGARSILQRVGRTWFKTALGEYQGLATATRLAMNPLSRHFKAKLVLETFVRFVNLQFGSAARVSDEHGEFFFEDAGCIYCIGIHTDAPICFPIVGTLQEMLHWALESKGDEFQIQELTCSAKGDATCRYRIVLLEPEHG